MVNPSLHFDTRYHMDGVRMIGVSVATPGDACVAPTGVVEATGYGWKYGATSTAIYPFGGI